MIRRSIRQLAFVLKDYRLHLCLAFVLSLLPSYFAIWTPYIIGRIIDATLHMNKDDLMAFGFLLLFLRVAHFILAAFSTYALSALGLEILVDYRRHLMKRLILYPFSYFDEHKTGALTTRLTSDIHSLNDFLSSAMLPLFGSIFLILGGAGVMLWMEWRVALAALVIFPLFVALTVRADIRIRRRFFLMRQSLSSVNANAAESFSGAREIQVFNVAPFFKRRFNYLSSRLSKKSVEAVREYAHYNPLVPFMTGLMDSIILGFGGWLIFRGDLSVGSLVAFLAYSSYFGWPLREFSEKLGIFQQAVTALERLADLGETEPEIDRGKLSFVHGDIRFGDLSHRYHPEAPPAVSHLDFTIKKGERVAFVGKTGSGKTTTCSLLMRFYLPTSGSIEVGSRDIQSFSLESLRRHIVWISQDIVLFSASIRENIRLFDEEIRDAEIMEALERVSLGSWYRSFSRGLDEELTERGSTLSGGQRQLLALARALVRKPKILILDEATSSIDYKTEALVQEAVEAMTREFPDMTLIVVAHRVATAQRCDRILVFQEGRVIEEGSYSEITNRRSSGADLLSGSALVSSA